MPSCLPGTHLYPVCTVWDIGGQTSPEQYDFNWELEGKTQEGSFQKETWTGGRRPRRAAGPGARAAWPGTRTSLQKLYIKRAALKLRPQELH